jgi:hypothetical protein
MPAVFIRVDEVFADEPAERCGLRGLERVVVGGERYDGTGHDEPYFLEEVTP